MTVLLSGALTDFEAKGTVTSVAVVVLHRRPFRGARPSASRRAFPAAGAHVGLTLISKTASGGGEGGSAPVVSPADVRLVTVKSRRVTFFVEAEHQIWDVMAAIEAEVLPRYSALPHFLGFVALQSELGPRPEIVLISMWDEGLEDSEVLYDVFRDEIQRVTGMLPARQSFDIVRVMVRDTNGDVCLDSA